LDKKIDEIKKEQGGFSFNNNEEVCERERTIRISMTTCEQKDNRMDIENTRRNIIK